MKPLGTHVFDVLVVGGGIIGLSTALRLSQSGVKVCVLERSAPGMEASSAAAGILAPQMESEGPGPFLDLCLQSRAMYPAWADELRALTGMDVQYLPSGVLFAAMDEADAAHLRSKVEWQRARGLRAELLSGAEARRDEPQLSERVLCAACFPDDHQVDNRLLVRALSLAAAKTGVLFRQGQARSLAVERERILGVDVDGEPLSAGAVVLAAGSWSGLIPGAGLSLKEIRPAKGQMICLSFWAPAFQKLLVSKRGYLVPRQDGRVIAGSTVEFAGFNKDVTGGGLSSILSMALELCPALAEAKVVESWAGLRPYTPAPMPFIGPGPVKGLFFATGHYRNGILLAPITAQLLTEAILGPAKA